jgi:hypothetical protein
MEYEKNNSDRTSLSRSEKRLTNAAQSRVRQLVAASLGYAAKSSGENAFALASHGR